MARFPERLLSLTLNCRVLGYLRIPLTIQIHHFLRRRIHKLLRARKFLHASRRKKLGFLQLERCLLIG